jgi:hypothetical protein
MSQPEFIPENYLAGLLAARLAGKKAPRPIPEALAVKLPETFEVSARFLDLYRHNLRTAVQKKIVSTLRGQRFFFSIGGQTEAATVADTLFWQQARFSFSLAPAMLLWRQALSGSRQPSDKPTALPKADLLPPTACTPWDSLILLLWQPSWHSSFPPDRFLPARGDWLALALRLALLTENELWESDPCALLPACKAIEYPVRFLLISWIGNYIALWQRRLHDFIAQFRTIKRITVELSSSSDPEILEFQAALSGFRTRSQNLDQVFPTFLSWENENAIGYDDASFLRHAASETRLRENIQAITDIHQQILGVL